MNNLHEEHDITYTTKLAWLVCEVVLFPGAGLPQRALDDDLRAPAHPRHRAEETVGVGDLWNRILPRIIDIVVYIKDCPNGS